MLWLFPPVVMIAEDMNEPRNAEVLPTCNPDNVKWLRLPFGSISDDGGTYDGEKGEEQEPCRASSATHIKTLNVRRLTSEVTATPH
jgi:hypothetical protein